MGARVAAFMITATSPRCDAAFGVHGGVRGSRRRSGVHGGVRVFIAELR